MDIFEDFKGFAIQTGCVYETFYKLRPAQTAAEILKSYKGSFVEIGYDSFPRGIINVELTIPEEDESIYNLFSGIETDYIYIDFKNKKIPFYVIQKIVVGNQIISQVEREK